MVDAVGHYRGFSSFGGLIGLLTPEFTVHHYARRGRGGSTGTAPYAVEREVEDSPRSSTSGGSAFVYAFSSGGLLTLHAAGRRLAIGLRQPDQRSDVATAPGLRDRRDLVLDSQGSSDDLSGMAATAARLIPNASHRSLAGEWQ